MPWLRVYLVFTEEVVSLTRSNSGLVRVSAWEWEWAGGMSDFVKRYPLERFNLCSFCSSVVVTLLLSPEIPSWLVGGLPFHCSRRQVSLKGNSDEKVTEACLGFILPGPPMHLYHPPPKYGRVAWQEADNWSLSETETHPPYRSCLAPLKCATMMRFGGDSPGIEILT